jgi:hypothetical protein
VQLTFWEFLNDAGSVSSLIGLPVGIAGTIAIFASWANKMARTLVAVAFLILIALLGADISVRARWFQPQLVDVHDQVFIRQDVPIDYHSYEHCKFINVTFVINGKGPFSLASNEIVYPISIRTENTNAFNVVLLVNGLGLLKSHLLENGRVVPPFGENPTFKHRD